MLSLNLILHFSFSTVISQEFEVELSAMTQHLIEEALKLFFSFCNSILSGEVTFHQMECTQGRYEYIEDCYRSAPGQTHPDDQVLKLTSTLRLRGLEYESYTERKNKLYHLARLCDKIAPGTYTSILHSPLLLHVISSVADRNAYVTSSSTRVDPFSLK